MSTIGGNNSIQDGLVFAYDTGNTRKSFKGEPTENLSNNRTLEKNGSNEYLPYESIVGIFDTYGVGTYTVSFDIRTPVPGQINMYTMDGTGRKYIFQSQPILVTTEWVRHVKTIDVTLNDGASTVNNLSFYGTYGTGRIPYVRNVQIEKKPYGTPFVDGTRLATNSLLDLTKNNTIDVTNTSFDSEGQMFFDGVDDYVDLGSDIIFKEAGGWSIETITRFDIIGSGWGAINSPGNFIGSDVNTNNSWYWALLNGKLALWNKDPGVWKYGSTIIQPNQYYHTVLTCSPDGTSYQMYLNGEPEGGDHVAYSWNPIYSGLRVRYIGTAQPSSRPMDGNQPLTKIYNKALTPQEVKRNFQAIRSRFNI